MAKNIYNSATIYMPWNLEVGDWSSIGEHAFIYNLGRVTIGSKTTIFHRAHLCAGTHDYTDSRGCVRMPLSALVLPLEKVQLLVPGLLLLKMLSRGWSSPAIRQLL